MGKQAHHQVQAEWVAEPHRFLHHSTTDPYSSATKNEHRYEADWYLGYDDVSERMSFI